MISTRKTPASTIIVSLTTISGRLNEIEQVLQSLNRQTIKPDAIRLYLSEEPFLFDEGVKPDQLPEFLSKMIKRGDCEVMFTRNTGPYRKLLPCLEEHFGSRTVIVTADDDTIYPPDWIANLLRLDNSDEPGSIVAYGARVIESEGPTLLPYVDWKHGRSENLFRNFPVGKYGVLYRANLFDERVLSPKYLDLCASNDDIWFKIAAFANGVGAKVWEESLSALRETFDRPYSESKEALYTINSSRNLALARTVLEYFGLSEAQFVSRIS